MLRELILGFLAYCASSGCCRRYGMLDPSLKDKEGLPLTIRAVFIVGEHTPQRRESCLDSNFGLIKTVSIPSIPYIP